MDALITLVCDEHTTRDPTGPLITRVDGTWAYCAGNGASGHRWRQVPPTTRQELEEERE